jgi:hypothetical protein
MTDTMTSQNIDLSSWDTLYNEAIHRLLADENCMLSELLRFKIE